jgi:hypothetical protein
VKPPVQAQPVVSSLTRYTGKSIATTYIFENEEFYLADEVDRALAATQPAVAPAAPSLFDRKLANLQERGYEVIGRILHKDGEYALFDSSCRWLTQPQYQRLMHEQDGSLFATVPAQGEREALRKLCDQLDGMKRTMFLRPGTGQHYSYLVHEDVQAYVEQARAALAAQVQPVASDWKAVEDIADELEQEAMLYEGDFADTVKGCAEALRTLALAAAPAPAQEDKQAGDVARDAMPVLTTGPWTEEDQREQDERDRHLWGAQQADGAGGA